MSNDKKADRPKVTYDVRDPLAEQPVPTKSDPPSGAAGVAAFAAGDAIRADHATPFTYRAFPTLLSEQEKTPAPAEKIFGEHETEKRAIWIVHGMGQQIPFATLDSLTEGILSVAKAPTQPDGTKGFHPRAISIQVGDQVLQRVELKVRSIDDKKDIELHMYEAYWAPLTEGVAKLRDVTGFLVNGATRGILNSFKPFKRAMFGQICEFKVQKRVPFYISTVLLVLASLVIINAVIAAATGSQVQFFGVNFKVLNDGWGILTAVASAMCALGITLGAILFLAGICKAQVSSGFRRKALSWISWSGAIVTIAGIIATALLFVLAVSPTGARIWLIGLPSAKQLQFFSTTIILATVAAIGLALSLRAKKRSEAAQTAESGFLFALLLLQLLLHIAAIVSMGICLFAPTSPWLQSLLLNSKAGGILSNPMWVWPFLIFLSAQVRTLMVEYVGDVVIYVTSNKIDRFSDVRKKIKDTAYKSASAVFHALAEDGKHFEYEKVAIVGHSLGSVIAYDTLDTLINEDRMTGGKMRITERTCLLETFGSPLNKIAFFFTIQGSDSFQIREQLAESVQPMIMNYQYRLFPWINVRSPNDIISGEVYLYDWPVEDSRHSSVAKAPDGVPTPASYRPAQDHVDPDAAVALAAHVDYWKNRMVWDELYKHVAS